jgi:hypothetical protein
MNMDKEQGTDKLGPELRVSHVVKAYRMYRRMMLYPHLLDEMRELFVAALQEKGIATFDSIKCEALSRFTEDSGAADEESIQEYIHALIDIHFARNFDEEQIENYINLARKNEAFQKLNEVVNREDASFYDIKRALKAFSEIPQGFLHISPDEAEGVRVALIDHLVSNQLPFIGIAKNHITIRDIDEMLDHFFFNPRRTGKIGGKAAGMFLAYRIVLPRLGERDPDLEKYVAFPESYYFSSGILTDFIDHNRFYSFHSQKYKSRETIEAEYENMTPLLEKASFPGDVVEELGRFLKEIGEHPLILRSSSLLEDNFGFAFSGKYDSVFIANQGDLQTRLNEFMRGLKQVLKSTFSPGAILYRRDHNLLDFDERMSVLVQKVVGRRFGSYFFPLAAGVAFSRNIYPWTDRIISEEGMVRLAVGLGTRAVDRVAPDYPRMVALSHPMLRPEVDSKQICKYSQKLVDVVNFETRRLDTVPFLDLFSRTPHPDLFYAVSILEGGHLSPPMFKGQEVHLNQSCITLDNFLTKTPFVSLMKKILKKLELAYGRPVDVEFAWDDDKLYILQCRSLAVKEQLAKVVLPEDIPKDRILFTNNHRISNSIIGDIEYIVYVDPKAYSRIAGYDEKLDIARVVSRLNRVLENKRFALFGPTRWGSNDINFGVKVGYQDINHTLILGEIAFEEEGSTPEVSYGTHFFNDLVEAEIVPLAIYPDQTDIIFEEDFLLKADNLLSTMVPEFSRYATVVHLIHVPSSTGGRLLQVFQDGQGQQGIGVFAHLEEIASQ